MRSDLGIFRKLTGNLVFENPSSSDIVSSVKQRFPNKAHPRVMADSGRFAQIKNNILTDEFAAKGYEAVKAAADKALDADCIKYSTSSPGSGGTTIFNAASGVKYRIGSLGIVYKMTGEAKYAERGKKCRDYRLHEDKFLKENMENEFNFRGIKKYEPTDAGLNTDFKSPGYFGGENRRSVRSEQGQTDGGIEFAFNTGWENSRRTFYKNRERIKENPHSGVSHNRGVSDFNNLNYGIGKRVFSLVKSVSGISKKKCYDEDDTAALSLITGLSAASVCILIELIKNARDKDLTEGYIEEMVEKLGGMNMQ